MVGSKGYTSVGYCCGRRNLRNNSEYARQSKRKVALKAKKCEAILGAKLDSIQDHLRVIECAEYDYWYRWRFGLQTRDTIEIQRAGQGETEKDDVDSALTQALQSRFEPIDMFYFESAIRDRQRLAH